MSILNLSSLLKVFPNNCVAVRDFSLKVEDGEFIVLLGPSGCGKSTVLRMIAGLDEISEGELYIDGRLCNHVLPKDRDIAMVFQNYALYPHMSVFENMAFGLKLRKLSRTEITRRVEETSRVLEISHLLTLKPGALSGGQRQRVALGRAIVRNPKIFLLDEPLSNLEARLRSQTRTEILRLQKGLNRTFIYVTHDQSEALAIGDRIVVMKEGVIQQIGTPHNIYNYPYNEFVASFIGSPEMNFVNAFLIRENGGLALKFGKFVLKLPKSKNKHGILEQYEGSLVVFGFRTEHTGDSRDMISNENICMFEAEVDVTEISGSQKYLYLTMDDGTDVVINASPGSSSKSGDRITVFLDPEHIHIFDKRTEQCITN